MDVDNLADLEEFLQNLIDASMVSDVAPVVKEVMQKHVQTDVYDVYMPSWYQRTGKLKSDIIYQYKDGDLEIIPDDEEEDLWGDMKYIPDTIEYGHWQSEVGYDVLMGSTEGNVGKYTYLEPRPFVANTFMDLEKNKQHIDALKRAMRDYVDIE